MKNLVLSCLAVCALVTVVGCSSDNKPMTSTDTSATMSSDTKDMGNHHMHSTMSTPPAQ